MLSPYSLDYAARISVILLPWAGLPWMLAFLIRGAAPGAGGGTPRSFAIVGADRRQRERDRARVRWHRARCSGSRTRSGSLREVRLAASRSSTVVKIGVLTLVASLWWMSGLWAQGAYGLDILQLHRDGEGRRPAVVAQRGAARARLLVLLRRDKLGPWIESSADYTQQPSGSCPATGSRCWRWSRRRSSAGVTASSSLFTFVGVAIAVGAHPYDSPSLFGGVLQGFADRVQCRVRAPQHRPGGPLVVLGPRSCSAPG